MNLPSLLPARGMPFKMEARVFTFLTLDLYNLSNFALRRPNRAFLGRSRHPGWEGSARPAKRLCARAYRECWLGRAEPKRRRRLFITTITVLPSWPTTPTVRGMRPRMAKVTSTTTVPIEMIRF